MQVNDEYLDELFARKLGDMTITPPEDGWLRIEKELIRRGAVVRKFWMAAASFALVLSVTATIFYIQTNRHTADDNLLTAMAVTGEPSEQHPELQVQTQAELVNSPEATRLNPQPATRNLNSKPETRNSELETRNPELGTRNPNDETLAEGKSEQHSPRQNQTRDMEPVTRNPNGEALNEVKPETFIPEYVDSWDEILRTQPFKPSRLDLSMNSNLQPEKMVRGNNETAAIPVVPVYHDMLYADVSDISSRPRSYKRWEVSGQFAPMHSYRSITSVPDGLRRSDFDKAEKPLQTYSGGVTVAYKALSRLSIQTGLYYSQMGQSISNVTPVNNMYTTLSSNSSYSKNFVRTSSGSVTVASNVKSDVNTNYSSYFNPELQSDAVNNVSVTNISASVKYRLIERIEYLEIPLIVHYRIIDRKLNLYALGGMSANMLVGNNVFVDNGSELVKGGTILMARPVNYSSTIGLGLGYQMTGKLLITLEPSFKYYLLSYSTNSQIGSNPYAFGLFTGVIYCF